MTNRPLFSLTLCILTLVIYFNSPDAFAAPAVNNDSFNSKGIYLGHEDKWEIYGNAKLSLVESGVQITTSNPPGGIFFKYKLEPTIRYQVEIIGKELENKTTFRQRINNKPLNYSNAPDGLLKFTLHKTSNLELLFYSDLPNKYIIESISITQCKTCFVEDDIAAYLLTNITGLDTSLKNNKLLAARLLLDWTANNVDWMGYVDESIELPSRKYIEQHSPAESYFNIFQKNQGGVYCGGIAEFLNKLYHIFDINSFLVSFGKPETNLTHMTVLIPMQIDQNSWEFYIFDPMLNLAIRDKKHDSYLDVIKILSTIVSREKPEMRLETASLINRDWVYPSFKSEYCQIPISKNENHVICRRPFYTAQTFFSENSPAWEKEGFKNGIDGLFELFAYNVFFVGKALDPVATDQFKTQLNNLHIPIKTEN